MLTKAMKRRPETLAPVWPSAAIRAAFLKRLLAAIEEMHHSTTYWLGAAYRRNLPEITTLAADVSPARTIDTAIKRLSSRWLRRFDRLSRDLARWFAKSIAQRNDASLRAALRRAGFSVELTMSKPISDSLDAIVAENVALIKSIPQRYLTAVQGHVMRSVTAGRDLKTLSDALQREFGVTKRRAALIARDQNNKATAAIQRARLLEIGIGEARWVHSGAGKEPRPSHVKASRDGVVFDLAKGWWDPNEKAWILPGQLINCRCVGRPVITGFS